MKMFVVTMEMSTDTARRGASVDQRLNVPREALRDFCIRHHIGKLAFFGSVLRDDFGPESDVDVLVEYLPGHVPGFAFITHQDELSEIIGRKVDLNTPNSLSRRFRERVRREAKVVYVRT